MNKVITVLLAAVLAVAALVAPAQAAGYRETHCQATRVAPNATINTCVSADFYNSGTGVVVTGWHLRTSPSCGLYMENHGDDAYGNPANIYVDGRGPYSWGEKYPRCNVDADTANRFVRNGGIVGANLKARVDRYPDHDMNFFFKICQSHRC